MKHQIFLLLITLFATSGAMAQRIADRNYSLQIGTQWRLLRPIGLNYALDQFNINNTDWEEPLQDIRWTNGLSFAAGIHTGRSEVRFQVQTFRASSFGSGPDSLGNTVALPVDLSGQTYQVALASNLIQINKNLSFGVGGAFSMNRMLVRSGFYPEADYNEEVVPDIALSLFKPSLNLIAPINIGIMPWLGVKIEPTYQVFFAPSNFSELSQLINGSAVNANDPALETESDHFGVTISLVGYVNRRY